MQKIGNNQDYRGYVVFVEGRNKDGSPSYYNGEYVIVEQSPMSLFGVKCKSDVYDVHNLQTFPLDGAAPFTVVRAVRDDEFLRRFVKDAKHAASAKERGEKTSWSDSVYYSARRNAEKLEALLCPYVEATPTRQVIQVGGTKITIIVEPA